MLYSNDAPNKTSCIICFLIVFFLMLQSCSNTATDPKMQAEKFTKADITFFELKGNVKKFGRTNVTNFGVFPVAQGDMKLASEKSYFSGFSQYGLVYNFHSNGFITSVQVANRDAKMEKIRTEDTLITKYTYSSSGKNSSIRILSGDTLITDVNIPSDYVFGKMRKKFKKIDGLLVDAIFKKINYFECNDIKVINRLKNTAGLDSLVQIDANIYLLQEDKKAQVSYYLSYPKYDAKGNWIKKNVYFLDQPLIGNLVYSSYRNIEYYE